MHFFAIRQLFTIAIARKYHYSLRIVTLEGELLNAGGSMTGGAFKNTSNLLGRRREIEELENSCNRYLKQADSIQQELSLQEATAAEKKEISEQLRNEIQKLALSENTIRINISTLEDKKNEIADSSADLVREHALLEEQVREITEGRASLKAEEGRLEERNTNSQKQIDEKSLLLNQEKLLRENCSLELSKIQLESSALEQQLSFISENENRVIGEIRKLKDEDASLEAGKNDSRKAIEEKEAAIIAIQKEIESSKEDTKVCALFELPGQQKSAGLMVAKPTNRRTTFCIYFFLHLAAFEAEKGRRGGLTGILWSNPGGQCPSVAP